MAADATGISKPSSQREPLLRAVNLSKSFGGVRAVDNVSVDLFEGEVVALVGDNGAGKSTFIKMLSGAYRRDSGSIYWEGHLIDPKSPAEARHYGIETLYQTLAIVDNLDAAANVFLGRERLISGVGGWVGMLDNTSMREETAQVIRSLNVNIPSIRMQLRYLSGGQRQSVAIARSVLFGARLVIMDEPLAALGVEESRQVMEIIRDLKSRGLSILVISHNLEHVFTIADRVIVLKNGRLMGIRAIKETTKPEIVALIMGERGKADEPGKESGLD